MKQPAHHKYSYFVSCCRRYRLHKERLDKQIFDPTSRIERRLKEIVAEEISFVDEAFKRIGEFDPKLASIMWLKLVEGKPLRQIDTDERVAMSKRAIIIRYPQKNWESIYDKIFTETI